MPDEEFFVGYLDTPPRTKRFVLAMLVALLTLTACVAVLAASAQRHPGRALEPSQPTELRGLFVQRPYPHIRYLDDGRVRHALTALGWKAGLGDRFAELDGRAVRVGGRLFGRGGRRLLVVAQEPTPIDALEGIEVLQHIATQPLGDVSLAGEIVDSKCFYGQMRPGDGRAHRACAQLCVRGGIAPVFVTRSHDDEETHYVLTSPDGSPFDAFEYMAEPVRIRGTLSRRADLWLLAVTTVERL